MSDSSENFFIWLLPQTVHGRTMKTQLLNGRKILLHRRSDSDVLSRLSQLSSNGPLNLDRFSPVVRPVNFHYGTGRLMQKGREDKDVR
ncbi:hypothetical protein RvY_12957-1 [Ramazzottius varieornatus]|uniref:Uncharacterized protein n=1 Tax=Ramazzottius varieornatus TaxID=947166 RepID=A0A1D1VTT3_RAMVA|nr:hypothetical protein RvY_12957-1 [Ramazzottius varieornatus]